MKWGGGGPLIQPCHFLHINTVQSQHSHIKFHDVRMTVNISFQAAGYEKGDGMLCLNSWCWEPGGHKLRSEPWTHSQLYYTAFPYGQSFIHWRSKQQDLCRRIITFCFQIGKNEEEFEDNRKRPTWCQHCYLTFCHRWGHCHHAEMNTSQHSSIEIAGKHTQFYLSVCVGYVNLPGIVDFLVLSWIAVMNW